MYAYVKFCTLQFDMSLESSKSAKSEVTHYRVRRNPSSKVVSLSCGEISTIQGGRSKTYLWIKMKESYTITYVEIMHHI